MAEFLRPEARAALFRWREALIGLMVAGIGLWLALAGFGVTQWLGWAVVVVGAALTITGIQIGRFRGSGDGPGVVTVDERRVAYFGPISGGMADLDLLARLELLPEGPTWRLVSENGAVLDIPTDARGAEQLLDLFAALPGMRIERLLHRLRAPGPQPTVLWQAPDPTPRPRLH